MIVSDIDFSEKKLKTEINKFGKDLIEKRAEAEQKMIPKKIEVYDDGEFPSVTEMIVAIESANNDMMARTLTKQPRDKLLNENFSDALIQELCPKIKKYFKRELRNEMEYDKWHFEMCKRIKELMERYYVNPAYGKAQKIINMIFKYLYCFLYINDKKQLESEKYFEYCHMPLDSTILEWIKRQFAKEVRTKKLPAWSNMDYIDPRDLPETSDDCEHEENAYEKNNYYTYNKFVKMIRGFIKNYPTQGNNLTPLQAEFVIWDWMSLKLAAEEFLKKIGAKDEISKTLKEDMKTIGKILNQGEMY